MSEPSRGVKPDDKWNVGERWPQGKTPSGEASKVESRTHVAKKIINKSELTQTQVSEAVVVQPLLEAVVVQPQQAAKPGRFGHTFLDFRIQEESCGIVLCG